MIQTRLQQLREKMSSRGITVYVIPTSDFHGSEYISDYFKCREYMSGFTGSTGTLLVTETEALLYTDGRYFIQAERELQGSSIRLMKMGEPGVISQEKYIQENIGEGFLGFDARIVPYSFLERLGLPLSRVIDADLVDEIWRDRPARISRPAYILEAKYCGKSADHKLAELRETMQTRNIDVHILTSLDDIAWLFNIRGDDIAYNPVVLSYAVICRDTGWIYLDESAVTEEIRQHLEHLGFQILPYQQFYEDLAQLTGRILIEKEKMSCAVYQKLAGLPLVFSKNPTTAKKAVKNLTEIENLRKAHQMDGVAVTKFMYWLKQQMAQDAKVTELDAAEKLESFRRRYPSYQEPSFETISAYEENAAMMHYSASEASQAVLRQSGFLLVDSGGQYLEGTTDVTRTFALGDLSEEAKKHFTLVVKSMLQLANAVFLYGCRGVNLDILAREALWREGLDYKCGTGHGVGYLLNVHEGPNSFRWRSVAGRQEECLLEPGMVTTDEPGIYLEGKYGIRIENELLCVEKEENEYGKFLQFEQLTRVPIDLDAINVEYLNKTDIQNLNNYHQMVYNTINPFLDEEEKSWLKEYTRPL